MARPYAWRTAVVLASALTSFAVTFGDIPSTFANSISHKADPAISSKTLVALGDSITFGYNLGDNKEPSSLAFPFTIARDDHFHAVDLGVPGWTTQDLLTALSSADFKTQLPKASVITVDIGSNDLLQAVPDILKAAASGQTNVSVTTSDLAHLTEAVRGIGQNLPAIIAGIRAETTAPIVLYNLYNPFPDGTALHAIGEQVMAQANQIIEATGAQTGCLLADAYESFNHRQMTFVRVAEKDIHPTAAGQVSLAEAGELALASPLWHQPMFYAVSPAGVLVRLAPSSTAEATYWLHGSEGDPVTGAVGNWLQIALPTGKTGYVPQNAVTLMLRLWNDVSFRTPTLSVLPGVIAPTPGSPGGETAKVFDWNGMIYAPISYLAREAGAKVTWVNSVREVHVSTKNADPTAWSGGSATTGPTNTLGITWNGSRKTMLSVRTEGIAVTVDGEMTNLGGEAIVYDGNVYVPALPFWMAVGKTLTPSSDGLLLLSGVDS